MGRGGGYTPAPSLPCNEKKAGTQVVGINSCQCDIKHGTCITAPSRHYTQDAVASHGNSCNGQLYISTLFFVFGDWRDTGICLESCVSEKILQRAVPDLRHAFYKNRTIFHRFNVFKYSSNQLLSITRENIKFANFSDHLFVYADPSISNTLRVCKHTEHS